MKDNLFELLMNLFDTTLSKLQEKQTASMNHSLIDTQPIELKFIKAAKNTSLRIFTQLEQYKLTKASYQLLMRMKRWKILDADAFELVMNQLAFSESHIINLEETKWTIRTVLSSFVSEDHLAFLDLVLYQKKLDGLSTH